MVLLDMKAQLEKNVVGFSSFSRNSPQFMMQERGIK